jgi:hypothetical protein
MKAVVPTTGLFIASSTVATGNRLSHVPPSVGLVVWVGVGTTGTLADADEEDPVAEEVEADVDLEPELDAFGDAFEQPAMSTGATTRIRTGNRRVVRGSTALR